uniref:CAP-Gly domain-containing protein n=1 Tax=Rhabditophanes sp. KR3021 TaxID=114890 RepID=A0AC35TGR4_9BILA
MHRSDSKESLFSIASTCVAGYGGWSVGDRCKIGVNIGTICFIGLTKFSTGEWIGVALDEPLGKNAGEVQGTRYFECEPSHGLFVKASRLARTDDYVKSPSVVSGSMKRQISKYAEQYKYDIGDRVIMGGGKVGSCRFLDETNFAKGIWAGVELDSPLGKNDGSVKGERYFTCRPNYGIFVCAEKATRAPTDAGRFVQIKHTKASALRQKSGSHESLNSIDMRSVASYGRPAIASSRTTLKHEDNIVTLQNLLKERDQHIDQIMKERDMYQSEMERFFKAPSKESSPLIDTGNDKKLESLAEEVKNLSKQILEKDKMIEDLNYQLEEVQVNNEVLNEAVDNSKVLPKEEDENIELELKYNKLVVDNEKLQSMCQERSQELMNNSTAIKDLQTELNKAQRLLSTTNSTESVISELNSKLLEKNKSLEDSHKELVMLKTSVNKVEDELRIELNVAREENKKFKFELEEVKSQLSCNESEFKEKTEKFCTELAEFKEMSNKLDTELVELKKSSLIESEAKNEKIQNLLSQMSSDQLTLSDEKSKLDAFQTEIQNLKTKLQSEEAVSRSNSEKLALQIDECKQLAEQLNTLKESRETDIAKVEAKLKERDEAFITLENKAKTDEENAEKRNKENESKMCDFVKALKEKEDLLTASKSISAAVLKTNEETLEKLNKDNEVKISNFEKTLKEKDDAIAALKVNYETSIKNAEQSAENSNKENEVKMSNFEIVLKEKDDAFTALKVSYETALKSAEEIAANLFKENEAKISHFEKALKEKDEAFTVLKSAENNAGSLIKDYEAKISHFESTLKQKEDSFTALESKSKTALKESEESTEKLRKELLAAQKDIEDNKVIFQKCVDENKMNECKAKEEFSKLIADSLSTKNSFEGQISILQQQLSSGGSTLDEEKSKITQLLLQINDLETECEQKNSHAKLAEDKISAMILRASELENELSALKDSKEKLAQEDKQTIEAFECKLKDKEASLNALEEQLKQDSINAQKVIEQLKEDKSIADKAIDKLKEEKNIVEEVIEKMKEEKSNSENVSQKLKEETSNSEKVIQKLKDEVLTSNQRLEEIQRLADEEKQIIEAKSLKVSELENELSSLKELKDKLVHDDKQAIVEMQNMLKEKDDSVIALEQKLRDSSINTEKTIENLKQDLNISKEDHKITQLELTKAIEQLKVDKSEAHEQISKLTEEGSTVKKSLEDQLASLNERLSSGNVSLDEEKSKIGQLLEKVSSLESELIRKDSDYKLIQERFTVMVEQASSLEAEVTTINELKQNSANADNLTITDLQKKLEDKENICKELQTKLDSSSNDAKVVLENLGKELLNVQEAKAKEQLNLEKSIEALKAEKAAAEEEVLKLKEENIASKKLLESQLDSMNSNIIVLQNQLSSGHLTLDEDKNKISQLETEASQLKTQLISYQKLYENKSAESDELQKTASNLQSSLTRTSNEQEQLIRQMKIQIETLKLAGSENGGETNVDNSSILNELNELKVDMDQKITLFLESEQMWVVKTSKLSAEKEAIQAKLDEALIKKTDNAIIQELEAKTAFLDSVIASQVQKIDSLSHKNAMLIKEPYHTDPLPLSISTPGKVQRMYCDICEIFDKHETEDCPTQDQDYQEPDKYSPPPKPKTERVKLAAREYCEHCEEFGHDTEECPLPREH